MGSSTLHTAIEERKAMLLEVKTGLIERLNLYQTPEQIDDDTPLFGSGLKLDSVDATELLVLLDKNFGIRVNEGDDPSYMRSVNTLVSFIIDKKAQNALSGEPLAPQGSSATGDH
ncbi:acyl carrier protein [Erwinia endophytica]|uniref:phosphopantetheine-binding protein n=1 Tax=Erwinia endophytica TaxID=1563158 RepID=UPI0012660349|nr:phosphopantetheine-binding protein [Erwinia endophytica]KAB8312509.1 acyl carrier protein [Erwinia endophytica]